MQTPTELEGLAQTEAGARDYALERLTMLQDGVFAIAMTLLALDLRAPPGWHGRLTDLLWGERYDLLAYGFSFAMAAVYWNRQRQTMGALAAVDGVFTALSLTILGLVTLIAPAMRLALSPAVSNGSEAYFLLFALIGLIGAAQWLYARHKGLLRAAPEANGGVHEVVQQLLVPGALTIMAVLWAAGGQRFVWLVALALVLLRRRRSGSVVSRLLRRA